jgi:hypothetical protein
METTVSINYREPRIIGNFCKNGNHVNISHQSSQKYA